MTAFNQNRGTMANRKQCRKAKIRRVHMRMNGRRPSPDTAKLPDLVRYLEDHVVPRDGGTQTVLEWSDILDELARNGKIGSSDLSES